MRPDEEIRAPMWHEQVPSVFDPDSADHATLVAAACAEHKRANDAEAARDRAFAEVERLRKVVGPAWSEQINGGTTLGEWVRAFVSERDALAAALSRIADLEATIERVRSHSRAVRMVVELAEQDTARDETGGEG